MSARRPLLLPLVPLYRAGLWWSQRRARPAALRHPVLSVGSISAGGAGKTPFVLALAPLLENLGYTVSILSRGYGRTTSGTVRVDPAGTAADFGDEPLLLARTLGLPVFVGSSRHAAGVLAESALPAGGVQHVHLLDDGFSHHALARTADIVLLTAQDVRDTLLPAGNLREPHAALRRARTLVVRASEQAEVNRFLAADAALRSVPVWTIDRALALPPDLPARPLLFSAIARPLDFERDVKSRGVAPAAVRTFSDHHRYTHRDMAALCTLAASSGADGFLTTAKDAVKLTPSLLRHLSAAGRVAVAALRVTFHDPEQVAGDLKNLLA